MKNANNPVKNLFGHVLAWFRARMVRKVFGVAVIVAVIFLAVGPLDPSGVCSILAITAAIVALAASTADTNITRKQFTLMVKQMRQKHFARMVEGTAIQEFAFTEADEAFIKRKNRNFKSTIAIKLFFIIFLVVLLVQAYF